MKKALLLIAAIAVIIYAAIIIANDARTHQGAFMTTEQYRQEVAEGKR